MDKHESEILLQCCRKLKTSALSNLADICQLLGHSFNRYHHEASASRLEGASTIIINIPSDEGSECGTILMVYTREHHI